MYYTKSESEEKIINAAKRQRPVFLNIFKILLLIFVIVEMSATCPVLGIEWTRWLVRVGALGIIITLKFYEDELLEVVRKLKGEVDSLKDKG